MAEPAPTVYVVDDEPDVLRAIERLLHSVGLSVATFPSARQFLERFDRDAPGCLVLDLALPDLSGLELQRLLEQQASLLPIIFLTGRGDIPTSVQAMKRGAADFLTKPVDDTALIAAIRQALVRDQMLRRAHEERERVAKRLATLTDRERQVFERIVAGKLNKQIAADLGTVEKTIKFHRSNLMHKMGVRVVADLVKLARASGRRLVAQDLKQRIRCQNRYLDQGPVGSRLCGCYPAVKMVSAAPLLAVVDDDADVRVALTRLVASAGFSVETFASGGEFLHSIEDHEPDCVVLDLHMPEMSGFDVQGALAAGHAAVPVIVITGHDTPESRARAIELGAKVYLCKPVNDEALLAAIDVAIGNVSP